MIICGKKKTKKKNRAVSRLLRIDKLLFVTSAHHGDACNYRPPPRGPVCLRRKCMKQPRPTDYSQIHAAHFHLHVLLSESTAS